MIALPLSREDARIKDTGHGLPDGSTAIEARLEAFFQFEEEGVCGEPWVVRVDQESEVLRHVTLFDGGHADVLQSLGKPGDIRRPVELAP